MSDRSDLSAYLDGELEPAEREALEAELAADPELARELEELEGVRAAIAGLPSLSAPPEFGAQIMSKVAPLSAARGARSMHPELRGYEGLRARHERRQRLRKREATKSSGGDPFVEDPFADAASPAKPELELPQPPAPDLEALGPELCAFVDGELDEEDAAAIAALAARDASVARHLRHLVRLRSRIGTLPRLSPPADFGARLSSEIDALEREQAQRALQARQARLAIWQQVGRLAQAACFLVVVGGGLFLTRPEERSLAGVAQSYRAAPPAPPKAAAALEKLKRAPEAAAFDLPEGDSDSVQWNLTAKDTLAAVMPQVRGAVGRFAQRLDRSVEVETSKAYGRLIEVPANRIDDLLASLSESDGIAVPVDVRESLEGLHSEQDRVVLKSGFVLVGRATRVRDEWLIRSGQGLFQVVPLADVERVEPADALRKIRLTLR